jgi:holin-like protein
MIRGLLILLGFQLAGELLAEFIGWPIPGPVIGMILLFAALLARGGVPEGLKRTSQGLLAHLSLLFIPAGSGIIAYVTLIRREWLPLSVSLVGSTILAMAVTALTMQRLVPIGEKSNERDP